MSKLKTLFLYLDAIGLVVFTIIGCQLAESLQLPVVIILLSGMITGCAGGVLRDVLCNDIPLLFRKEIYASASIVTGTIYLLVQYWGGAVEWAVITGKLVWTYTCGYSQYILNGRCLSLFTTTSFTRIFSS